MVEPRDKSFEELADIVKANDFHIIEFEVNVGSKAIQFDFLQKTDETSKTHKLGNDYFDNKGMIEYFPESNQMRINWKGKPPESIVMGVNGYIWDVFEKTPDMYVVKGFGIFEPYSPKRYDA